MATTGLIFPPSEHPVKSARIARNILLAVILILFAVLTLFPIFYMIMSSFGPAIATAGNFLTRSIFPSKWTLDSYKAFFSSANTPDAGSSTASSSPRDGGGNVIFASMAGYAFSKINFKGRQWLFGLILVAMMIPYQVTQVPLYILIANKLHMTNTYAAMILPGVVTSYNIFLAKQFFTSIPTPLIESRQARRLQPARHFRAHHPAAFQNRAGGHGDQHVPFQLEHVLLAVPCNEQGLYIHDPGRPQDLQVCERDAGAEAMSKTILAVGAHIGDMELTCGALLAANAVHGDAA